MLTADRENNDFLRFKWVLKGNILLDKEGFASLPRTLKAVFFKKLHENRKKHNKTVYLAYQKYLNTM